MTGPGRGHGVRCLQRRYRLDEPVGRGGMATVWRGYDLRLQRTVAVKLLSPALLGDPAARDRIRREALAAAPLDHPGVARVYDYGEQRHLTRTPTPFLVLEFVTGRTLAARLRADGPLAPHEALRIGQQVADALAAAHEHGVVHRDVKPGNIMLTPTGVKVVDFGIAAGVGDDVTDPDGLVWGTPAYLPPEQAAGAEATPAGDVFALGVVITECLTGRTPRRAPHEPADTSVPTELAAPYADLLRRCLATEAAQRPTAAELAAALAPGTTTSGAGGVAPGPARPAVPARTVPGPTRRVPPVPGRATNGIRRGVFLAAPAVAVAALAGVLPGLVTAEEGSADAPPAEAGCSTRYQAQQQPDGSFTARITVTGTGDHDPADRTLTFNLPAGQRLLDVAGAAWTRDERRVTLRLAEPPVPGAELTATLHGRADTGGHEAPRRFSFGDLVCDRSGTHVRTSVLPERTAGPAATTEASGGRRAGAPTAGEPRTSGRGAGGTSGSGPTATAPPASPSGADPTAPPSSDPPPTTSPPTTQPPPTTSPPTTSPTATQPPESEPPSTPEPPSTSEPPSSEPSSTAEPTPDPQTTSEPAEPTPSAVTPTSAEPSATGGSSGGPGNAS
ncbi:protein kinase [Micromonospora sp. NPDC126480]|uniref:protein kinase domain-containing protein n=1 Tax=Micromonospora sp. NPDC126480 TaxID=3155312 RepID=UPI0033270EE7